MITDWSRRLQTGSGTVQLTSQSILTFSIITAILLVGAIPKKRPMALDEFMAVNSKERTGMSKPKLKKKSPAKVGIETILLYISMVNKHYVTVN